MPDEDKRTPEIEEGEFQRYMDAEAVDGEWNETNFLAYLQKRYEEIQAEYQALHFNLREAEGSKREEMLARLAPLFRANYKSRKFVVLELRKRGLEIKDRFVL